MNKSDQLAILIQLQEEFLMENTSLLMQRQCSFCYHTSPQAKHILRSALLRLGRMIQERRYTDLACSNISQKEQNGGAMSRLIRILFDQNEFQIKLSKNCEHLKLKNWLLSRLGCRSQQLQIMLDDMCDRVARRNYELQIIASQIKHVQSSVIQLGDSVQLQKMQQKISSHTSSSVKQESQVVNQEQVSVKLQQAEVPKIYEGSPQTGMSYGLAFSEMPYSYNYLLYGSYLQ